MQEHRELRARGQLELRLKVTLLHRDRAVLEPLVVEPALPDRHLCYFHNTKKPCMTEIYLHLKKTRTYHVTGAHAVLNQSPERL